MRRPSSPHAGLNCLYTSFSDPYNAANAVKYPDDSAFGESSAWPLTIVNAAHVYHMLGGFSLSSADYFHHFLFIPLLGFPGQVLKWGPVQPAGAFFISGLPGGLTYLMLGLVKLGWFSSIKEKRVTANLNSWVRVPGILITAFLCYQACIYGNHSLPSSWWMLPSILLGPFNALYYNKQAVANLYARVAATLRTRACARNSWPAHPCASFSRPVCALFFAALSSVHYMTQLLGQDDVFKARLDAYSKKTDTDLANRSWQSPTSSAILQWKEAIANPQLGC
jgi:hypothetical protein